MTVKDFKKSELFTFEGRCMIWGEKDVPLSVDFPDGETGDVNALLAAHLPDIEKRVAWVNASRAAIEQCVVDDGMVELAEDWAQSAEEDPDSDCYIMEDGEKVCLPITEADFRKSLSVGEMSLGFTAGWDSPDMELYLYCKPDYFAGHTIIVDVDKDGNCECGSLAG